jgi:hypothetical protein
MEDFLVMINVFSLIFLNFAVQHRKSDHWMPEEVRDRR